MKKRLKNGQLVWLGEPFHCTGTVTWCSWADSLLYVFVDKIKRELVFFHAENVTPFNVLVDQ